jgi:hypothetical protein
LCLFAISTVSIEVFNMLNKTWVDYANTGFLPEGLSVLLDMLRSLGSSNWEDIRSHALVSIVVAAFWYYASSWKVLKWVRFASHFLVSFKLF